jgi:protoporphyrin/coproporphyrin ferrochelatase
MALSHDAVLLLAFGGPTEPEDIRPFLARVLAGHPVPPARIEEVVRHYEAVGGRSPLNDITLLQARALQEILEQLNLPMRVYVGFRHAGPFIRETLEAMMADGIKRALGFILSSHQIEASWQRYKKNVAEAREEIGASAPVIHYCPGWHDHPLFIRTWTEQIKGELKKIAAARRANVEILFTAHSVPVAMAERSPYREQLRESCSLVAALLNHDRWSLAYQSRSGNPTEAWLEPEIGAALRRVAGEGAAEVVVAPIGFVSDHVEVLYDLDIEAKRMAETLGLRFLRADAPNDRPIFIRMMADVIEGQLSAVGDQQSAERKNEEE